MKRSRPVHVAALALALGVLPSAQASAQSTSKPEVSVKVTMMREVVVRDAKGSSRVEMQPVDTAKPGDTLVYQILYTNTGDSAAHNTRVVDPIPAGTQLVPGSCAPSGAELTASVDGGKTFEQFPARRAISLPDGTTELRDVDPTLYTHLAWTSSEPLAPGAYKHAEFKVKVR